MTSTDTGGGGNFDGFDGQLMLPHSDVSTGVNALCARYKWHTGHAMSRLKPISKNKMKRPRPLAIPDAFQRACAEGGEAILYILVAECKRGDHYPRFQLSVAELALAYAYGRPKQMVDAVVMSPEQRRARLQELIAIAAPACIEAEIVEDEDKTEG
jgi:hypothetical protein